MHLLYYCLFLFWPTIFVELKPIIIKSQKKAFSYKNGFLGSMQATNTEIVQALKDSQNFFNIEATGKMDKNSVEMMSKSRCGMSAKQNVPNTWHKQVVTYKIINKTEALTNYELKSVIEEKIREWTKDINLVVVEAMSEEADIKIYFNNITESESILGSAYYPENGDIEFDSKRQWTVTATSNSDEYFFPWIAAHELGHSFGLEHINDSTKIMNPYYVENVSGPTDFEKKLLRDRYGNITLNKKFLCTNSSIDAMLSLSNSHLITKSNLAWTFTQDGLERGPFPVSHLWERGLAFQSNVTNMDAAFQIALPEVTKTYFLKDSIFYKIQSSGLLAERKSIKAGFPKIPDKIDAAFYYSKSVYFFKGESYYVYSVTKKRVMVDGAKIHKNFDGLPADINAATAIGDTAIFVKGDRLYRFNLKTRTMVDDKALRSDFFKC